MIEKRCSRITPAVILRWGLLGLGLALLSPPAAPFRTGAGEPNTYRAYLPVVMSNVQKIPSLVILDVDNNVRDWDWLRATFGDVEVHRAPDGPAYRVCVLKEVEGPSTLVAWVFEEGSPRPGVWVVRHWPDAAPLPPWLVGWYGNGDYGQTKENGEIGFGMGGGDAYLPPALGASAIWVGDSAYPSDLISGLGWLGFTEHIHLDTEFCLVR